MNSFEMKMKKYGPFILMTVVVVGIALVLMSGSKDKTPELSVNEIIEQSMDKTYTVRKDGIEYIFLPDGSLSVKGEGTTESFETLDDAKVFFLEELYKEHTGKYPKTMEQLSALNPVLDRVVLMSVEEGITALGDFFCSPFYYLEEISLPETVKRIGTYTFLGAGQFAEKEAVCYGLRKDLMNAEETSFLVDVAGEEILPATMEVTEEYEVILREEEELGTEPEEEFLTTSVSMGNGTYLRLYENGVLFVDGRKLPDFEHFSELEEYLMKELHCMSPGEVKRLWFDRVVEIVLPYEMTYIGSYSLAGYRNALAVTGGTVKEIGTRSFSYCGADREDELLWDIAVSDALLAEDAFKNCKNTPFTKEE